MKTSDRLTGKNYRSWKVQMMLHLKDSKLWKYVAFTEDLAEMKKKDTAFDSDSWTEKSQEAAVKIMLCMDPSILDLVDGLEHGKDVWGKLKEYYEATNMPNQRYHQRKLHALKLGAFANMEEYLMGALQIKNDLAATGFKVSEDDLCGIVMNGLPQSYNMLVTTLEQFYTEDKPLTMAILGAKLTHEAMKLSDQEIPRNQGLIANVQNRERKPKDMSKVRCYNCQKMGHYSDKCQNQRVERASSATEKKKKGKELPKEKVFSFIATTGSGEMEVWYIDSGASRHMTCNREWLTGLTTLEEPISIYLADNSVLVAKEEGTVTLKSSGSVTMKIERVLLVDGMGKNLFSVCQAAAKGISTKFNSTGCTLEKDGEVLASGTGKNGTYTLEYSYEGKVYGNVALTSNAQLWHQRLGHLGEAALKTMVKDNMVTGLHLSNCSVPFCGKCAEGKLSKTKFPTTGGNRSKLPLELLHMDVCGPMDVPTPTGYRYFMVIVDDATRYTHVALLKEKSEAFDHFVEFKNRAEKYLERYIKAIQSDPGGEFVSKAFIDLCIREGIERRLSNPRTPEQNGVAERKNRSLMESARSMLHGQSMAKTFWGTAINTACYIQNRCPTNALVGMTPHEAWTSVKPDLSHLRIYGCEAYVHVDNERRKKLDPKAIRCRFIGYGVETKGYLFVPWDNNLGRVIESRNAKFNEGASLTTDEEPQLESDSESDGDTKSQSDSSPDNDAESLASFSSALDDKEDDLVEDPITEAIELRKSERLANRSASAYVAKILDEPSTFKEAMESENSKEWKMAMDQEMESIISNGTWVEAKLPNNRKAIGCKWVFKLKRDNFGNVSRYKARLVAKGYNQKEGIDYGEIFAPVAKYKTIRTLLAIAVQNDMTLGQLDVKTAFLNGVLQEEIYMVVPPGYPTKTVGAVYKLVKSLYGLKQSPMEWNAVLDVFLKKIGYLPTTADPCLYTRKEGNDLVILAIYVDDIIVAASGKSAELKAKKELMSKFEMTDLGELNWFLGMKITRDWDDKTIKLGQSIYVTKVLVKFGMMDCKVAATPMGSDPDEMEKSGPANVPYREAVGCLMYAMIGTRPDIAYAVGVASRYLEQPEERHWVLTKRIMRYLRGTLDWELCYKKDGSNLVGYSDADWAGDRSDRRSTSGYVFTLAGAAVCWLSKKQPCVALSTTEAEYIALCSATQEAAWMLMLVNAAGMNIESVKIMEDNQGCIALTKNSGNHGRTKHIDIKYHYIREMVLAKKVHLTYCPTMDMAADILTKPLDRVKFEYFRGMLGLVKSKDIASGSVEKQVKEIVLCPVKFGGAIKGGV